MSYADCRHEHVRCVRLCWWHVYSQGPYSIQHPPATSPSPFVSNSPIPTTTTTTTTTTTMMLSLVATTTSTTRTSASSSSVPSDPTPYVTTTPPLYIDAPTPNIGTVQGVADSQPLTLTLAPALGVTLPIILALLLVVAILLVCLLSFRSKR